MWTMVWCSVNLDTCLLQIQARDNLALHPLIRQLSLIRYPGTTQFADPCFAFRRVVKTQLTFWWRLEVNSRQCIQMFLRCHLLPSLKACWDANVVNNWYIFRTKGIFTYTVRNIYFALSVTRSFFSVLLFLGWERSQHAGNSALVRPRLLCTRSVKHNCLTSSRYNSRPWYGGGGEREREKNDKLSPGATPTNFDRSDATSATDVIDASVQALLIRLNNVVLWACTQSPKWSLVEGTWSDLELGVIFVSLKVTTWQKVYYY